MKDERTGKTSSLAFCLGGSLIIQLPEWVGDTPVFPTQTGTLTSPIVSCSDKATNPTRKARSVSIWAGLSVPPRSASTRAMLTCQPGGFTITPARRALPCGSKTTRPTWCSSCSPTTCPLWGCQARQHERDHYPPLFGGATRMG